MNACVNERPVFDRQTESAPERSDRSVRPRVEMPELYNPSAPADSMTAFPWEDLMRVLVVEDESSISGFIRQGLSEAGFVVTVEADGQRGLRRADGRVRCHHPGHHAAADERPRGLAPRPLPGSDDPGSAAHRPG